MSRIRTALLTIAGLAATTAFGLGIAAATGAPAGANAAEQLHTVEQHEPVHRAAMAHPTGSADFPAYPTPAQPVIEGSWTGPDGTEWPAVCQFGVDQLIAEHGFTVQQGIDAREQCHV